MNNTPQLRFPGFTGEWSEKKLGEIVDINYGTRVVQLKDGGSIYPVYGGGGATFKMDTYNRENCVVIARFAISQTCTRYIPDKFFLNDSGLTLNAHEELLQSYLDCYILSINDEIYKTAEGMAQKNLNLNAFKSLIVRYPISKEEQQKLVDCFKEMDDLISAQGEKVDALKTRKKGLMQQLFPQNGETTPRLRFPGFTGEWSIRKVSEIFKITRGYVLPAAETKEVPDEVYRYPVYSSQTAKNGLMGYYSKALYKDAITWTTDGANAGTVRYRDGEFYCTNVCGVLISTSGFANNCIAEILNTVSKNYVSYVGNPKLMNNVMSEIAICIPPTIKEQQKIAECLSALDDLIASESAELEALKAHKKGLMQQLFPEPAK